MKAVAPEAPCGLLSNDLLTNPEDVVQELGFQAFHPWYLRVSLSLVRRLHARGIAVNVYTPNSPGGAGLAHCPGGGQCHHRLPPAGAAPAEVAAAQVNDHMAGWRIFAPARHIPMQFA